MYLIVFDKRKPTYGTCQCMFYNELILQTQVEGNGIMEANSLKREAML